MGRRAPHPLALFQTTIYCLGKLVLTASEMSGRRTNRAENSSLVMTAPDGTWDPAAQPCPKCMHCKGSHCSVLQDPTTTSDALSEAGLWDQC